MEKRKGNYEQQIAKLARQISDLKQEKEELYRQGHKYDSEEILRIGRELSDLYEEGSIVMAKNIIKKLKTERKELHQKDPKKNAYEIQKLTAQINDSYKQIKAAENRQKNRQDQMTVEEITVNIERLKESVEALQRNEAELHKQMISDRDWTVRMEIKKDLKNIETKMERAREKIAQQNEILKRREMENTQKEAEVNEQWEKEKSEREDREAKKIEERRQKIARKEAEKKEEIARRDRAVSVVKQLSKSIEDLIKEKNNIEKVWASTQDGTVRAEIRRDLTKIGQDIQEKSARMEFLRGKYSIMEEEFAEEPAPNAEEMAKLDELQRRIAIMKPENFEELYNKLPQEVVEKFKNQDKLSEEEIAEMLARINEIEQPQPEPNAEEMAKLDELQRRIGIMKPENFEELYNKLPQEVVEKFKNQDKLSEEEIAEMLARINEIEQPQPELNPEPQPQPPVPTPEDTFLDKIGNWFADKWNRISNFVLFKPFKWVFKGIKAFGKKFVEIMKLKPDEMDDIAWDDVYNAEFREVKEQEAENEEPVLPKVEAEIVEKQLKSQRQVAREIRKILKEQNGEVYEYNGFKIQNTGSLRLIAEYLEGKRKIEGKGRLIRPEEGDYHLRLKPGGILEPDYERPLKPNFAVGVEIGEDSGIDYAAIPKKGIGSIKVNENWRDGR